MIDRWCRLREQLRSGEAPQGEGPGPLVRGLESFTASLADDLNVAGAIGALSAAINEYGREDGQFGVHADELAALERMDSVLCVLDRNEAAAEPAGAEDDILARIQARTEAKANKDYAAADAIRDELTAMGIAIKDGPEGTTWSRIVE